MTKIVGIRFRNVGKIYYFDPKNYKMQVGDHVIVETARGVEFGRVVLGPKEVGEDEMKTERNRIVLKKKTLLRSARRRSVSMAWR